MVGEFDEDLESLPEELKQDAQALRDVATEFREAIGALAPDTLVRETAVKLVGLAETLAIEAIRNRNK